MILSYEQLKEKYNYYSDISGRIKRDVLNKQLFPVKKGLYETNINTDGLYLTAFILSPSYISFQYALFYHGLIPERVLNYTSATFNQKKSKSFRNRFGNYYYRDVPELAYPYFIDIYLIKDYSYFIATKEKALCDMLYISKVVRSINDLKVLLFEDLRINEVLFANLDFSKISFLVNKYNSTNITLLNRLIESEYLND